MHRVAGVMVAVGLVASGALAAEARGPLERELASVTLELQRGGDKVGAVTYKALDHDGDFIFEQAFQLEHAGKPLSWSGRVRYVGGGKPEPVRATVDTRVGKQLRMRAQVDYLAKGTRTRVVAALTSPKTGKTTEHEREGAAPPGPIVYSSTLWYLGPKLLPEAGAVPVSWVEFPDDIDNPINTKDKCTLTRRSLEGGGFSLTMDRQGRDAPLVVITYGKDGQVARVDFGKLTGTPVRK